MRVFALLALVPLVGCHRNEEEEEAKIPSPKMTLEAPAAAEWRGEGDMEARGTVANVETVTVAGTDGEVSEKSFTAPLTLARGITVVEARAQGESGEELFVRQGVIAGDFADPGEEVEEAVALRVNQAGLDKASGLVGDYLDPATLNGALTSLNPVYSDSYGVWDWEAVTIAADVTEVSFGTPRVDIRPEGGLLALSVSLPDLYVDINAYGEALGFDFDTQVALLSGEAQVTGTIRVGAEDGRLEVTLNDATVELLDFSYDASLLPYGVEDYILVDTIKGTIEDMVVEQIETLVPSLLEETLAGLAPSFSTEILGKELTVAYTFDDVEVDEDGIAMSLGIDCDIPSNGKKEYNGYLSAPKVEPEVNRRAEVAAAISDNLLNRVLFEVWRAEMVDLTLSTDDGSLDAYMLAPFHATQGTIRTTANLPPVIVEQDGQLMAQIGEMIIDIDTPDSDLGHHLSVAVGGNVPLEASIEDGELVLDVGTPALTLMVRESDWGASNETVTVLVEDTLPLDLILALLGNLSFPLPALYGLTFDSGEAERDEGGFHTGVTVELGVE